MCLITNTPIPTILDKDLVVYKVLYHSPSGQVLSPYYKYEYNTKYNYNEIIQSEFNKLRNGFCVYEAFHSCTTIEYARTLSFGNLNMFVYKCIIPKGSKVFFDRHVPEIASDTIIIKRRLWFNRW